MFEFTESPVRDVSFGEGMQLSLDSFYDVLKVQAGGLGASEFLQLKLVADGIDISEIIPEGSYKFFSYYNLLRRADLAIDPLPVSGTIMTGAVQLNHIYGKFLRKLRTLVKINELTDQEKIKINELDIQIERNKELMKQYVAVDAKEWDDFCKLRGFNPADPFRYQQWSVDNGQIKKIQELRQENHGKIFERKGIIEGRIPDADDLEIINAEFSFDTPQSSKLCYPTFPDFEYAPIIISLAYLSTLDHVTTPVFDDRYVITFDKTLNFIKTDNQGILNAEFSRLTNTSSSITTDWSASGSASYGFFIKVNASVSEHRSIQEDFKKATSIKLTSKSTIRVNLNYGSWFQPNLFVHKRVFENPEMFQEFFGASGSLLYYPTALIMIRGFGIAFKTSSEWTFDYERKFSASAGGGFSAFGINFGGSSNYGQHIIEHKFDRSATDLSINDDETTLRFVGYVVKKNDEFSNKIIENVAEFGIL